MNPKRDNLNALILLASVNKRFILLPKLFLLLFLFTFFAINNDLLVQIIFRVQPYDSK